MLPMSLASPDRGALRLAVTWSADGAASADRLELEVAFPQHYPWFAPTVTAVSAKHLARHREPFSGRLCLLAAGCEWDPTTLLADHLDEQLPKLLRANHVDSPGLGDPRPALDEAAEPEPVSAYMWARWPRTVLVDGSWRPDPAVADGTLQLRVHGVQELQVTGRILRMLGPAGQVLATAGVDDDDSLADALSVPWARVPTPSPDVDPAELWLTAERLTRRPPSALDGGLVELLAVVIREEVLYRQPGDSILLLVRQRADRRRRWQYGIVLTERAGLEDLLLRTPETRTLVDKRVLVCGVGALGGPLALELARAGLGTLDLVDGDVVTAGTVMRQLPGLDDLELPKTLAVGLQVLRHAPFCQVRSHPWSMGSAPTPPDDVLDLAAAADLVVDATANQVVTRFLASHIDRVDTPLLVVAATSGAWGGTVVRLPSDGGGCWRCLELHRADRQVPWPPSRPYDQVRPTGCSEPTFTGAGFQLAPVWQLGAAVATDALLGRNGDFADLHVLSQRDCEGRSTAPSWAAQPLPVHARCPAHEDVVQLPLFSSADTVGV